MADDKSGRDKQAHQADKRQRKRELAEELERWEETEPPIDPTELEDLERELDSLKFPASGADVVAAVGDLEIGSTDETYRVTELVPDSDVETFDSPDAVRVRVQRPTVAASMKRVLEAAATLPRTELSGSQREAYEKTLRALTAIDADDDDEGVRVISDWIIERIREKNQLPGSRDVRREAAKFCRANGYEIRTDEWLGI